MADIEQLDSEKEGKWSGSVIGEKDEPAGRILSSIGSDEAENGASEGARRAVLFWGEIVSIEGTEEGDIGALRITGGIVSMSRVPPARCLDLVKRMACGGFPLSFDGKDKTMIE